jgi:hypothetical protein
MSKLPTIDARTKKLESWIEDLERYWRDEVESGRHDPFDFEKSTLGPIEKLAWKILNGVGLTNAKLRKLAIKLGYPQHMIDEAALIHAAQKATCGKLYSWEWRAAQWLSYVRCIRRHGDYPQLALQESFELGANIREAQIQIPWVALENRARPFIGKGKGLDALDKIMLEMLPATYKEVLDRLEGLAAQQHPVIQEVDSEKEIVYWTHNGRERETPFNSIKKHRLGTVRKKLKHRLKLNK